MSKTFDVLKMKQTRGAIGAFAKQFGVKNGLITAFNTIYRKVIKGQDTGQAFFSSYWDALGTREAIVCGDKRINFAEFKDRTFRFANALSSLGVNNNGERVAVLLPNCQEWFEIMMGTAFSGRSMPMLNWHLKPQELVACINRAEAKVVVLDASFKESIESIKDQLETVNHFIILGDDAPEGMLAYEKLLAQSDNFDPAGAFSPSATPYSGGTTGTPKLLNMDEMDQVFGESDDTRRGATKDEVTALALMQLGAFYWYRLGQCHDPITSNIRSLVPGPLYHAGVQIAVIPFFLGGTVVPMVRFDPEAFLKTIQDERINWTFVAPTMLERVLALPEEIKARYNLSSMRSIVCAAAPCTPSVKKGINALFRAQGGADDVFMEYYGASETGLISVLVPEDYQADEKRYNSVGKIRAAECRVYNVEKSCWAGANEEGRILIRTQMALGLKYKGEQKKTDEAFMVIDGVSWYDDGLIGYLDEDEFLYLTSRAKEMIISGGVNVFPNEIEEVVKRHDSVFDVAVVRAPSDDLGEIPAAIIQLMPGEKELSLEEVVKFCKDEGLYGFKLPKQVMYEKELPRQLSGKLIKRDLEAKLWEGVETHG